jgi:hypothetical protein
MGFKVRYLQSKRETGHEFVPDLGTAKTLAENYAAASPDYSAEVLDRARTVVFRRPRTVRGA